MSVQDIFIPKESNNQKSVDDFHWDYGQGPTYAERTFFRLALFGPNKDWSFGGTIGSVEEENVFSYQFMVPYVDDTVLEQTYKLGESKDFHAKFMQSIGAPPGFTGFRLVDADDAELTIRLDPKEGTIQGDFNATYKFSRLKPIGTFKLKKDEPNNIE